MLKTIKGIYTLLFDMVIGRVINEVHLLQLRRGRKGHQKGCEKSDAKFSHWGGVETQSRQKLEGTMKKCPSIASTTIILYYTILQTTNKETSAKKLLLAFWKGTKRLSSFFKSQNLHVIDLMHAVYKKGGKMFEYHVDKNHRNFWLVIVWEGRGVSKCKKMGSSSAQSRQKSSLSSLASFFFLSFFSWRSRLVFQRLYESELASVPPRPIYNNAPSPTYR